MTTASRNKNLEAARAAWTDRRHLQEKTAKLKAKSDQRMNERQAITDGLNAIFEEYYSVYQYSSFWVTIRTRELKKLMRKHKSCKPVLNNMDFKVAKVKFFPIVKVLFKKK